MATSKISSSNNYLNTKSGYMAPVTIHCSYGDSGQTVTFYLFDGSEKLDLTGATVSVHGIRKDGVHFGPFACTLSGNAVSFKIQSSMTAVEGGAIAELTIAKGSVVVGSANFAILVENATFPVSVSYSTDPSVYQDILNYVQEGVSEAKEDYINKIAAEALLRQQGDADNVAAINVEKARIDNLISSGTPAEDSELRDIRVGADGVTYTSAGEAVRTQIENVSSNISPDKTTFISIDDNIYSNTNFTVSNTISSGSATNRYIAIAEGITSPGYRKTIRIVASIEPTVNPSNYSEVKLYVYEQNSSSDYIRTASYDMPTTQPVDFEITQTATRTISVWVRLIYNTTISETYTEKLKVNYLHLFEKATLNEEYVEVSGLKEAKDQMLLIGENTVFYSKSNPKAYCNYTASSSAIGSFNFDTIAEFNIEGARTIRIVAKGLRALTKPSNYTTIGIRLIDYDENNTVIIRRNVIGSDIDSEFVLRDNTRKVGVYLLAKVDDLTESYSEVFTADYLLISEVKAEIPESNNSAIAIKPLLPSYYFNMSGNSFTSNTYLESKIRSIPEGFSFLFCTDQHFDSGTAAYSNKLMAYVAARAGIKYCLFGGDILNANETGLEAYAEACEFMTEAVAAFGDGLIPCIGNHDLNLYELTGSRTSDDQVEEVYETVHIPWAAANRVYLGHLKKKVVYDTTEKAKTFATGDLYTDLVEAFKSNYYIDLVDERVRVVVISILQPYNVIHKVFGLARNEQGTSLPFIYDWVADTLRSTPDGYDVVFLEHNTTNPNTDSGYVYASRITQMIHAYKAKRSISFTSGVNTNGWTSATGSESTWTYSYDFTDANDIGTPIVLAGHQHCSLVETCNGTSMSNVVRVDPFPNNSAITIDQNTVYSYTQVCDSYSRVYTPDNPVGVYSPTMTSGTVTEHAFSVVTLRPGTDKITITGFGAAPTTRASISI